MDVKLRISCYDDAPESTKDIITNLQKIGRKSIKITTNSLNIERDRKDESKIKALNNIKFIYKLEKGCLLLMGNLRCKFKDNFQGEFFVKKIVEEPNQEFDSIVAVNAWVDFSDPMNALSNDYMYDVLRELKYHPNFVYNIQQFDDFMILFEFYKKLSTELNNNVSYSINSISQVYCFLPITVESLDLDSIEEVYDKDNIIIGYKFDTYQYDRLTNDVKDQVRFLVDIEIDYQDEILKRIQSMGKDNIYLSNFEQVSENNISLLAQVQIINVLRKKDNRNKNIVIISGELKNEDYLDYSYLNLYDMGQKIKVESIDNSLRLINQGASGAASELLRYLIGDEDMPSNISSSDEVKEKYMEGLNENQRKAFLMCVDGSPVSLIKGPPGTGKTHVINAIVQYITKELDDKVIISSQTHVAIDNVLDKLMTNRDAIIPNRITNRRNKYSDIEIDKTLYKTWALNFDKHNQNVSNKELSNIIMKQMSDFNGAKKMTYSEETNKSDYAVIGATTTTSAIAGKKGLEVLKGYNWLIIDEVSKCPITEVLRYLPYVEKIIMVGDDFQLAPLLEFTKEDVKDLPSYDDELFTRLKQMYESSVFEKTLRKAEKCDRVIQLNENYRSVKGVLQLYNVFYNNELLEKRNTVNPNKVQFNSSYLENDRDAYFIEVKNGKEANDGHSRFNIEELYATKEVLEELIRCTINPEKVSVAAIFPYSAQIRRFNQMFKDLINQAKSTFKYFDFDTVDAFQGKEADIVLCNTVVTDASRLNFLNDFRRINVSMSRAKDKLILFGNRIVLSKIEMSVSCEAPRRFFNDIIECIKINGQIITYEGGIKNENSSKNVIKFA